MKTALVIGLGTSGLRILEECQQFHYQFKSQSNKPDRVKYLYLETDINRVPRTTALGRSDIEAVPISLKDIVPGTTSLRKNKNIDQSWIPEPEEALAAGTGAGGNSAYGRLALWINYSDVSSKLNQAWIDIQGDNETYIYVVGTLTGGTCSGTCVDIAYMVREITQSDNVFGLFLTPSRQYLERGGHNSLLYNYFSAITGIQFYSQEGNVYDVYKPSGTQLRNPSRPYKQCYFLSQDYTSGFAQMELEELYKVAGLHIFARICGFGEVGGDGQPLTTFSDTLARRAIDMQQNFSSWMFSTFGSKMIYYPKTLIKELFGLQLASETLSQWIDPKNCLLNRDPVNINQLKQSLTLKTKIAVEQMIRDCFDKINGLTTLGSTLYNDITRTDVQVIVSKSHQQPLHVYIASLFNSENPNSHYALVENNKQVLTSQLIDAIYAIAVDCLNRHQNLHVLDLVLNAICNGIQETIDFWKKEYNIDDQSGHWKFVLTAQINEILKQKNIPAALILKEEYFRDELLKLLTLSKISVAIPALKTIVQAIKGDGKMSSNNRHELPSLKKVAAYIMLVRNTIQINDDEQKDNKTTLYRRINDIKGSLRNNHNFVALYHKDTLDNDLDEIRTDYKNHYQNQPFGYLEITQNKDLYTYLELISNSKSRLFSDCISTSVDYVNSKITTLSDYTILSIIDGLKHTPNNPQWQEIKTCVEKDAIDIRKEVPGLIRLTRDITFRENPRLPLIFLNADISALRSQVKYNLLENDCSCEIAGLSDAIIIYQEYGYLGDGVPPFDITIHADINKTIARQIKDNIDYVKTSAPNDNDQAFYFKRRVPYLSKEQFDEYLK